ncbi:hypothetical protein DUNSADRAFT_11780 [Dunaliella salina]|uniref:Uncharacterized protein n=1 Tax=Dunaliella salina TaxID=3046 RepID=A0ABQ7GCJ9_DUNSA|nr:hypothetical protein DUNSADRAFT_11780 [Dunaliella salina]|eukprot:KAF5832338.1 hypothetical protein DUNSADRAFT_11780 [Dunaliella salina]
MAAATNSRRLLFFLPLSGFFCSQALGYCSDCWCLPQWTHNSGYYCGYESWTGTSYGCDEECCQNRGLYCDDGCTGKAEWVKKDSRTSCSRECGGGTQKFNFACRGYWDQATCGDPDVTVDCYEEVWCYDYQCGEDPSDTLYECNTHACPSYSWSVSDWTTCSHSCGPDGVQSRTVECVEEATYSWNNEVVGDENCDSIKPAEQQSCNTHACPTYSWSVSDWTTCTHDCGPDGVQSRTVECVEEATYSWNNEVVGDENCDSVKPAEQQSCNTHACPSYTWSVSDWTTCTRECGPEGMQSRAVECMEESTYSGDSTVVGDENCGSSKPSEQQRCNTHACPPPPAPPAPILSGSCAQPHVVNLEAAGSEFVTEDIDTCPYSHAFGGSSYTAGPSFVIRLDSHFAARTFMVETLQATDYAYFDTMLFVSPSCSPEDVIASDDDGGSKTLSMLTFHAEAYQDVFIAVNGYSDGCGVMRVKLVLLPPPPPLPLSPLPSPPPSSPPSPSPLPPGMLCICFHTTCGTRI